MKIVISAFNFPAVGEGAPHFSDVPPGHPVYRWIETARHFGVALGYADGTFRPNGSITRAQLAKMVVGAAMQSDPASWFLLNPPSPTFDDVLPDSPYYAYIETAFAHGVISGYACSGAGKVCSGRHFLPHGMTTRAQVSKVMRLALLP